MVDLKHWARRASIPFYLRWEVETERHDTIKVWRNDWNKDQYEFLTISQFNQLSRFCKQFSIRLVEKGNRNYGR